MTDAWEAGQDGSEPEDCISHNFDDAIDGGGVDNELKNAWEIRQDGLGIIIDDQNDGVGGWHLLQFMFMNAPLVI